MKNPGETLFSAAHNHIWNLHNSITFFFKSKLAPPVFIYQMGKVGSMSIFDSLRKQYKGIAIHSHSFSKEHSTPLVRKLYQHSIEKGKPLKVISPIREPIGRNVAAFFENFEEITGEKYESSAFKLDELKTFFLERYNHSIPLKWFDNHILSNFGIDVYATPFPEEGYAIYQKDNIELLVIKINLPDEIKSNVLAEFTGLEKFTLFPSNIGHNKEYASTYRDFVNNVKFPEAYLNSMCDSKYFSHFYSPEAIKAVRDKWSD